MVTVTILNVVAQNAPPSSRVEYEARNDGDAPVWLVNDDWLIWNQRGREIEVSFKRGAMQPGSHVFGYFPPAVARLQPGATITKKFAVRWPLTLDRLWNAAASAAPPPGRYTLSVSVGYGVVPEPGPPALGQEVEVPVLSWQRIAVSEPVPFEIPSYELPAGDWNGPTRGRQSGS